LTYKIYFYLKNCLRVKVSIYAFGIYRIYIQFYNFPCDFACLFFDRSGVVLQVNHAYIIFIFHIQNRSENCRIVNIRLSENTIKDESKLK